MEYKTKFEGPWATFSKPLTLPTGTWRDRRPVIKADKCCHCGWCALCCPGGCMEDKSNCFTADLEYCKGCGICARICPVNAIMMVMEG